MREHLANHTFGFYLSISAGILSVVSLLFYLGADNQGAAVLPLIVCSILAEVAGIAINRFTGKAGVLMLIPTVNALLFSAAIILSIIPQVDSLGYLVSGLYSFEDMKAFILYMAGISGGILYGYAEIKYLKGFGLCYVLMNLKSKICHQIALQTIRHLYFLFP